MNWSELLAQALPGLGTALLAIISGAGGSALLDLFWKPRQERRKAAAILMADVLLNTELLLLQAHARVKNPKRIPDDFNMSLIGWDATSESLRELPAGLIKGSLIFPVEDSTYSGLMRWCVQSAGTLQDLERGVGRDGKG